jgi:hypothetical protein
MLKHLAVTLAALALHCYASSALCRQLPLWVPAFLLALKRSSLPHTPNGTHTHSLTMRPTRDILTSFTTRRRLILTLPIPISMTRITTGITRGSITTTDKQSAG